MKLAKYEKYIKDDTKKMCKLMHKDVEKVSKIIFEVEVGVNTMKVKIEILKAFEQRVSKEITDLKVEVSVLRTGG